MRLPNPTRRTLARAATLTAASIPLLHAPSLSRAADRTYVGPNNGFWSTPGNWSPAIVPVPGDGALLTPAAARNVFFDANYASPLAQVLLNGTAGATVTLSHSANTLLTNSLTLGNGGGAAYSLSGTGNLTVSGDATLGNLASPSVISFTQSGGTHTVTGGGAAELWIGRATGSTAVYNLSGGTLSIATGSYQEYVGYAGTATFNQTGGTHNVDSTYFTTGWQATGNGTYNLSAGTLNVTAEQWVGYLGRGTFVNSGGAHTVGTPSANRNLWVGDQAGSTGSYALSAPAASLTVHGNLHVGSAGAGTFNHSAGTATVSSSLNLGNFAGSAASYSLSGTGSLQANYANLAVSGNASFNQTGGTHTVFNDLTIGRESGSAGSYSLTGNGRLLTNLSVLGHNGTATFTQSAGTHTAALSLILGAHLTGSGSYFLSGTGTLAGTGTTVGYDGTGSFAQSGGSHNVRGLTLAVGATATGTYALSGAGTLTSVNAHIGYSGAGTFTHSAGSFAASEDLYLAYFDTSNAAYSLSGTGHLSTPTLVVADAGRATFAQSGGTNAVGALYLANAATATATYLLSGGSLSAYGAIIGTHGKANFTQTGGSFNVGLIRVGDGNSTAAALSVTGGAVTADTLVVGTEFGATGTVSITGGSITLSTDLQIHDRPGNAVTLSAGTLALPSPASLILHNNNSRFAWTGGTLSLTGGYTVDPSFSLGNLPDLAGPDITLAAGRTLATPSAAVNFGSVTLAGGALAGTGSFYNHSLLTGHGTLAQPVVNNALLTQSNGILAISAPLTNSPTGTIDLAPARVANLSSSLTNSGTMNLRNASVTGTGTLTNAAGGLLTGPGTIATATFSNAGTFVLPAGQTRTPAFTNTGVVQLDSLAANLSTDGTLTNAGTLEGRGRVSAAVLNNGTIEPTAGTLTLAAPFTNSAAGAVRIAAGSKLLATTPIHNAGSILLTGGTLDSSNETLINTGTLSVAAGLSTVAAHLVNNGNSKVIVTGGATAVFTRPVDNASPTSEFRVSANSTAVFLAPVTGSGLFTGTGAKHFESGPSSPSFLATTGSTTVHEAASLTTSYLHESSLTSLGDTVLLPGSPASTIGALDLSTAGTLDLADNPLTLTSTPVATIRQYLSTAQLFSSTPDPTNVTSLGYLTAGTTTLVRLTLTGDANLDGILNADDYALLDRGRLTGGQYWHQGDFNYDGTVNNQDYLLIDRTYALTNTHGPSLDPAFLSMRESQFGPAYVSTLLTSIPEPSLALSSLLYPLSSLLFKRRRQPKPRFTLYDTALLRLR
jgi:hypothetical protein